MKRKAFRVGVSLALGLCVAANGRALSLAEAPTLRVFVDPGTRELVVSFGDRTRRVTVTSGGGG